MSEFSSLQQKTLATRDTSEINKNVANTPSNGTFHAALPSMLEMVVSSDKGRAVHAKTTFLPGQSIVSLRPSICILSASCVDLFCAACFEAFAHPAAAKKCSKCRMIWYCNAECQLADWSVHKLECPCLQRVSSLSSDPSNPSIPPDAVRCLARILFLKRKNKAGEVAREIDSMHSLKGSLPTSAHASHAQLAHALVQYLGVESPQELQPMGVSSSGDLVDMISKFATNTHSLTTWNLSPIGLALSPSYALINHSCDHNAVLVFPRPKNSSRKEPQMQLIALRKIEPGEEITVSYIDTTHPCSRRRELLRETYGFECKCALCLASDQGIVDPRSSIHCPRRCGSLCPIPTEERLLIQCTKCNSRVTSDIENIVDLARIAQEGLDKATLLQDTEPEKALKLTSNLIPLLVSAGFTDASHPLLALLRLQHLLLSTSLSNLDLKVENRVGHQQFLDDAIRTAAKVLTGLRGILPAGHPIRGIHLAETGKLLAVDEFASSQSSTKDTFPPSGPARIRLAFETLVEAKKELLIGFGAVNEGGRVGQEVRDQIISLETELGIWKDGMRTAWDEQIVKKVTSK